MRIGGSFRTEDENDSTDGGTNGGGDGESSFDCLRGGTYGTLSYPAMSETTITDCSEYERLVRACAGGDQTACQTIFGRR